jgi:hypothetical protein
LPFCFSIDSVQQVFQKHVFLVAAATGLMRPFFHRRDAIEPPRPPESQVIWQGGLDGINSPTGTPSDHVREHQQHDYHKRHSEQPQNDWHVRLLFQLH